MEKQLKTFNYKGSPITFSTGNGVMVNATEMASRFGKQPIFFLNNQTTKEFLEELSKLKNLSLTDLVVVTKGGRNSGTWMHEDVALEFARWLSPKFAIWCNERIKELLRQGVTTTSNDDEAILYAIKTLERRVESSRMLLQAKEEQITQQQEKIDIIEPLADYTTKVLQSDSTYTMSEVAMEFGYSAHTFAKKLNVAGVLYKQGSRWLPYSKYNDKGYFATRTCQFFHKDGSIGTSSITVVTEKGRHFLHALKAHKVDANGNVKQ